MAQLELQPINAGKSKRRMHPSLQVDMTPMVDLGFLLITFFILTTTMSEQKTMNLSIPTEGDPIPIKESRTLSFILGKDDKVYAWEGQWQDALNHQKIVATNYDVDEGIGKLIRAKQKILAASDEDGKDALTLVIKPTSESSYNNLVAVLDETLINNVTRYAIVKPTVEEKNYLAERNR